MGKAVGIVEVYGLVAAFAACDAGCKAGNVTVERFDKNKPANADSLPVPLLVAVKFRGVGKFFCHGIAHVGVQEGLAHLLDGLGNVNIGDASFASQRV